jgi:hypothetical protein
MTAPYCAPVSAQNPRVPPNPGPHACFVNKNIGSRSFRLHLAWPLVLLGVCLISTRRDCSSHRSLMSCFFDQHRVNGRIKSENQSLQDKLEATRQATDRGMAETQDALGRPDQRGPGPPGLQPYCGKTRIP